jgi:hypothetical protein
MSTPVIVSLVVGGALVVLIGVVLVARRGGASNAPQRRCGGCRRIMMPDWQQCMFCSWVPLCRLEFRSGPLAGHVTPLTEEVTTIGSVAGNTIVLADPAVSRKHLGIRRVGAHYEFADLGSTNGVYVNGHRTAKKTLELGDILRVGNTEMLFTRD